MITEGAAGSAPAAGPVAGPRRIAAIDSLRGFALLGILVMNIAAFAFPMAAYFNPTVLDDRGLDFAAWVVAHLFFELKMMGIFSMLFGAGVVLMARRAEAAGRPFGRIYYRRTGWLLALGLLHAYLVWHGDILVTYALCGALLFLFRRRGARTLIVCGLAVLVWGALLQSGAGYAQSQLRDVAAEIEVRVAAGEPMTPRRQRLVDQWNGLRRSFAPTPQEIEQTRTTMRGGAGEVLRANVHETIGMHTQAVPFFLLWRALGMMLLGMGLMKAGVFEAARSPGFYRGWMVAGFGLGLPLVAFGIWRWSGHGYDFIASFVIDGHFNYFGSVLVSLGYTALLMRLTQVAALAGLRERLAAVGRMALSNYLMQSALCALIFYGYGLGWFGYLARWQLWGVILGIWALQLALSPWWLARYRFGPAEWLWRTLTYWQLQPMRRS